VVTALKSSPANDMRAIAPRLLAYGRALDLDAKWALAADVYETVIAHVHPVEESDVAITALLRRAYCERSLGELDSATRSYDAASHVAQQVDDLFGILRAQVGSAKIATARGNMPQAEQLLDQAIVRAGAEEYRDVRAMALQDRATVAHLRGNFDLAVRFAYRALEITRDGINRDRLLADIAGSFYMLGVRSAARDAYAIIEATAQEQYQRWVATINLMEIAATDGSAPLFERYRKSLADAHMPPTLQAEYQLHVGTGYELLGESDAARAALERARTLAENFGFHQIVFKSEEALSRVADTSQHLSAPAESSAPAHLNDVVEVLGDLRRSILV
jgi:tetratricopeptide (TPR) repeat protein